MTESPEQPPKLDYSPPDPAQARSFLSQAVIAAIWTAALLVTVIAAWLFVMYPLEVGGEYQNAFAIILTVGVALGLLALLTWLSVHWYRVPRRRGVIVGLWIGVGLAALIEG